MVSGISFAEMAARTLCRSKAGACIGRSLIITATLVWAACCARIASASLSRSTLRRQPGSTLLSQATTFLMPGGSCEAIPQPSAVIVSISSRSWPWKSKNASVSTKMLNASSNCVGLVHCRRSLATTSAYGRTSPNMRSSCGWDGADALSPSAPRPNHHQAVAEVTAMICVPLALQRAPDRLGRAARGCNHLSKPRLPSDGGFLPRAALRYLGSPWQPRRRSSP